MNTASVAGLLGVSQSTIQRWVKQLDLDIPRNGHGHFHFDEEAISVLKHIREQISKGVLLHDVILTHKRVRKGKVEPITKDHVVEVLFEKINDLERMVNGKADQVVSYQLLSHRRELEELENKVTQLNQHIEHLEEKLLDKNRNIDSDPFPLIDQVKEKKKVKKRNLFTMLFGY